MNYGYCIYEDLSGSMVEEEQGYTSWKMVRHDAERSRNWYTDNSPRGTYSWEVYDVIHNETLEVSE